MILENKKKNRTIVIQTPKTNEKERTDGKNRRTKILHKGFEKNPGN